MCFVDLDDLDDFGRASGFWTDRPACADRLASFVFARPPTRGTDYAALRRAPTMGRVNGEA